MSRFSASGETVQQTGGQRVHVDTLAGPHIFEPSPKDRALLRKVDVLMVNGLGLEGWLDRLIKASGFQGEGSLTRPAVGRY